MNVARYIDSLLCSRCTWPTEDCTCIRAPLDMQREWRDVQARHQADVARARRNNRARKRAA